MSKPVSRVIGIIRIREASEFGVDLPVVHDDSTLGSLLAGLVNKQGGPRGEHRRPRFEAAACGPAEGFRNTVRANLHRLRDELEREYVELAVR